jgi:acyl carrier protein phosphodiesterase
MNVLAHALLAGNDEWLTVGGVMGDFVRGTPDPALPPGIIAGIRLHRAVDTFTDSHEEVVAARALIPPPYRRYAGILLDVWFDHCLARDFTRWSEASLEIYSTYLRTLLHRHDPILPPSLGQFLGYMERHDLPLGYQRLPEIARALEGISRRLSRANPLGQAMPLLEAKDVELERHFSAFFPQLRAFAAKWIAEHPFAPVEPRV